MVRIGLILGAMLVATAAVITIIDLYEGSEGASTQVVPRRYAKYPALAGAAILVLCAIAAAFP